MDLGGIAALVMSAAAIGTVATGYLLSRRGQADDTVIAEKNAMVAQDRLRLDSLEGLNSMLQDDNKIQREDNAILRSRLAVLRARLEVMETREERHKDALRSLIVVVHSEVAKIAAQEVVDDLPPELPAGGIS